MYDDFTLDGEGNAFLAVRTANEITRIKRSGGPQVVISGMENSTDIVEPTAVEFGRTAEDRRVLYVTTGGGQLAAIDIGR